MDELDMLRTEIAKLKDTAETNDKWQKAYSELYKKYKEQEQHIASLEGDLERERSRD